VSATIVKLTLAVPPQLVVHGPFGTPLQETREKLDADKAKTRSLLTLIRHPTVELDANPGEGALAQAPASDFTAWPRRHSPQNHRRCSSINPDFAPFILPRRRLDEILRLSPKFAMACGSPACKRSLEEAARSRAF
jgi:hypothetical protein